MLVVNTNKWYQSFCWQASGYLGSIKKVIQLVWKEQIRVSVWATTSSQYNSSYRQYTTEEIEESTEYFSDTRRIGEGGYKPVYKCHLDNIPPLSWQHRFRIAAEICSGLLFLHQTKPANILLDRNSVSKVADVGLARLVPPFVKTQ
ncbi:U-box domain-containing protein 52-like protein isoform X1 [Tanacetum coccineum]